MKRHVQTTGIRNWAGDDLIELQSESLKVLDEFFGHFGPCIISGCEIEGNKIKPGIVGLSGYDEEEEKETYKVVPFEGAEVDTFPVYLSLNYEIGERIYGDMKTKPIFYSYYAELSAIPPEGDYFTIKETGNHLFVDAIQDPDHRFLTDEQVDKLTGIFHDDGSYLFIGTDITLEATDGNIIIKATDAVEVNCKDLKVSVADNIEIEAENNIFVKAKKGNTEVTSGITTSLAGGNSSITINENIDGEAENSINLEAQTGEINMTASDAMNLTSKNLNAEATETVEIQGATSSVTINEDVEIQADKDFILNAQTGNSSITAKNTASMVGSDAGITLNDDAAIQAGKNITVQAKNGKADISASDTVNLNGTTVNATGSTSTTIKGATSTATLNSDVNIQANKDAIINAQTGDTTITAKNNTTITGGNSTITINDHIEEEAEKDIILTARTGKVSVSAKNEVEINASDLNLSVDKDINLKAGKNLTLEAQDGKTDIKASDEILLTGATSNTTINDSISIEANKNLSLQAKTGKADLSAKDTVNITGTNINTTGSTATTIKGGASTAILNSDVNVQANKDLLLDAKTGNAGLTAAEEINLNSKNLNATGSTATTIKGGASSATLNSDVNVQANKDLTLNANTGNAVVTANDTTTLTGSNSTVTINENIVTEAVKAVSIQAKSGKADITASDAVNLNGTTVNATGSTATTIKGGASSATLNSNIDIQATKNLTLTAKAGNATITASDTSSITGGNSGITANENIEAEAEKDITLKANSGKVSITANDEVEINANELNLSVTEDINLEADKNLHLKAKTGEATLTAAENVSLTGKNLNATGSTTTTIKGGSSTATLNSNINLQANNNATLNAKAGNAAITASDTTSLKGSNSNITINEDIKTEAEKNVSIQANNGKAELTASEAVNLSGKVLNATGTDTTTIKGGASTATLNTHIDLQANNNITLNAKAGNATITASNTASLKGNNSNITVNEDIKAEAEKNVTIQANSGKAELTASEAVNLGGKTLNATGTDTTTIKGGSSTATLNSNIDLQANNNVTLNAKTGETSISAKNNVDINAEKDINLSAENIYLNGDLAIDGQLFYHSIRLTSANNIDEITTEGKYYAQAGSGLQGTLPEDGYFNHTSSSLFLIVGALNGTTGFTQILIGSDQIYTRIVYNTTTGPSAWYRQARESDLSRYLPLTGGDISGDLTVNGNFTWKATNITNATWNIDTIYKEGHYYAAGSFNTEGTLPDISITAFALRVERLASGFYVQTMYTYSGTAAPRMFIRHLKVTSGEVETLSTWREVTDLNSYLLTSGGTVTGDLKVEGQLLYEGIRLRQETNIDELLTPGTYWILASDTLYPSGTFPSAYTTSAASCLQVYRGNNIGGVFQILINGSREYRRFISGEGTVGSWTSSANNADLSAYLPLTGGTLSGPLHMEAGQDINLSGSNNKLNIYSGSGSAANMFIGYEAANGLVIQSQSNAGLTLRTRNNTGGSIKLVTPSNNTAYLNGVEIATANDLKEYLPLTGGTVTGDLTVDGQFNYPYTDLSVSSDLDTLLTPGFYTWTSVTEPQGTYPSEYISSSSTLIVAALGTNSVSQTLINNNIIYTRTVTPSTVYAWYQHARTSFLSSYLPLAGGTMSGQLDMSANKIHLADSSTFGWDANEEIKLFSTQPNGITLENDSTLNTAKTKIISPAGIELTTNGASGKATYNGIEIATVDDLEEYLDIYPIEVDFAELSRLTSESSEEEIREVFGIDPEVTFFKYLFDILEEITENKKTVVFFDKPVSAINDTSGGIIVTFSRVISGLPHESKFYMTFVPYRNNTINSNISRTFLFRVYQANHPDNPGELIEFIVNNYDLADYLPLEGGTIMGDLTVNGKLQSYAVNAQNINIDELKTEGIYYSPNPYNGRGTLPPETTSTASFYTWWLEVRRIGSTTYHQHLTGYTNSPSRDITQASRIITSSSIGEWYRHDLTRDYLKLSGGTMEGTLNLNSNYLVLGTSKDNSLYYNGSEGMVIQSSLTQGLHIKNTSSGNINITTNTGKATYNGNEIATINDIPDTNHFIINGTNPDEVTISSDSPISLNSKTINIGEDTDTGYLYLGANKDDHHVVLNSKNVAAPYIGNIENSSYALGSIICRDNDAYLKAISISALKDKLEIPDISYEDNTGIIWVNCNYTGNEEKGTIDAPYKTITKAVNNRSASTPTEIRINPGEYNEGLSITGSSNIHPLFIVGCKNNHNIMDSVKVDYLYLSHSTLPVSIQGMTFKTGSQIYQESQPVHIEDCTFENSLSISQSGTYVPNKVNQVYIKNSSITLLQISNIHVIVNSCSGLHIQTVSNGSEQVSGYISVTSGNVTINNCYDFRLHHSGGIVTSIDSWYYTTSYTSETILSTASESNSNGLYLYGGGTLYDRGVGYFQGNIKKTGTCEYILHNFTYPYYQESVSFPGKRLDVGVKGNQVLIYRKFDNFDSSDYWLTSHLEGVDTKLGELTESLEEVSVEDNSGIIWVNCNYTGIEERGTIDAPYKTITQAIENVQQYVLAEIRINPGTYDEDIILDEIKSPVIITAHRTNSNIIYAVEVNGLYIKNDTLIVVSIQGVKFKEWAAITGSNLKINFENCIFNDAIEILEVEEVYLSNCSFWALGAETKKVTLNTCSSIDTKKYIEIEQGTSINVTGIVLSFSDELNLINCDNILLYHVAGKVYSQNTWFNYINYLELDEEVLQQFPDDVVFPLGIISIADKFEKNSLCFYGGGVKTPVMTNENYYMSGITMILHCEYRVINFIAENFGSYEPYNYSGLPANQVLAYIVPSHYSRDNDSLISHLKGIDSKLGTLSRTVTTSSSGLVPSSWYNTLNNLIKYTTTDASNITINNGENITLSGRTIKFNGEENSSLEVGYEIITKSNHHILFNTTTDIDLTAANVYLNANNSINLTTSNDDRPTWNRKELAMCEDITKKVTVYGNFGGDGKSISATDTNSHIKVHMYYDNTTVTIAISSLTNTSKSYCVTLTEGDGSNTTSINPVTYTNNLTSFSFNTSRVYMKMEGDIFDYETYKLFRIKSFTRGYYGFISIEEL